MTDGGVDEALDRLYAVPPDRFTAERDALAKELRATDRDASAAVKALRRPPVTAWALNQVARSRPDEVTALFDADAALAASQRRGAGRETLAEAARARREVIGRLVAQAAAALTEAGHPDSPANRDRIAQTLTAVAGDPEGREALARGRLTTDLSPASVWDAAAPSPFRAGAGPQAAGAGAGHQAAGAGAEAGGAGPDSAEASDHAQAIAAAERRRQLRDKADALTAEAKRLATEAARLDADAAKAEATARIARSVANEARRKADDAESAAHKADETARATS